MQALAGFDPAAAPGVYLKLDGTPRQVLEFALGEEESSSWFAKMAHLWGTLLLTHPMSHERAARLRAAVPAAREYATEFDSRSENSKLIQRALSRWPIYRPEWIVL